MKPEFLLRVAASAAAVYACTMFGWYFADRVTRRRRCLQQLCSLLLFLRHEIRYRKTDLSHLYTCIVQNKEYRELHFDASEEFRTVRPPESLTEEDAAAFEECFSGMGKQGSEQECERLDYFRERFKSACSACEQEELAARRLYLRLGFGVGVMIGITLL